MAVPGGDIRSTATVPATGEYTEAIEFSTPGFGGYSIVTVQTVGLTGTVTVYGCLEDDEWEALGGLTALSSGAGDGNTITADGIYQGQYAGVSKIRVGFVGSALTKLKVVAVA